MSGGSIPITTNPSSPSPGAAATVGVTHDASAAPLVDAKQTIDFDDVSKFYGEVLGVNKVTLSLTPGITSLVGPNGSGKTTLMNLMTGLLRPTQGSIAIRGISTDDPQNLFRVLGYCSQFDSFPKGMTGRQLIAAYLGVHGYGRKEALRRAEESIERVGLLKAADRKVAAYSKGMRQRIRLAQGIAHDPHVLVLDEPLNGLDPLARAEVIRVFQGLAAEGRHLIISSHILHEVDLISDRVVLINEGYIVAEGNIREVRNEISDRPFQILVRCSDPKEVARHVFDLEGSVEVRLQKDGGGLRVFTKDPSEFYLQLNRLVVEKAIDVEHVMPADETAQKVYDYLIGGGEEGDDK